jgi:hypothetical protein
MSRGRRSMQGRCHGAIHEVKEASGNVGFDQRGLTTLQQAQGGRVRPRVDGITGVKNS